MILLRYSEYEKTPSYWCMQVIQYDESAFRKPESAFRKPGDTDTYGEPQSFLRRVQLLSRSGCMSCRHAPHARTIHWALGVRICRYCFTSRTCTDSWCARSPCSPGGCILNNVWMYLSTRSLFMLTCMRPPCRLRFRHCVCLCMYIYTLNPKTLNPNGLLGRLPPPLDDGGLLTSWDFQCIRGRQLHSGVGPRRVVDVQRWHNIKIIYTSTHIYRYCAHADSEICCCCR